MEGEIIRPIQTLETPLLRRDTGWIIGLHADIKTQQEERKVKTQAGPVSQRYLLVERIECEGTPRLGLILTYGPYISSIHKGRHLNLPEQFRPMLYVGIDLHVA